MSIQLKTVETTEFVWIWPKDHDVRCVLVPCSTKIERAAARASKISVDGDGFTQVGAQVAHIVELVARVVKKWEGITGPDGADVAPNLEGVSWVMEQAPDFILDVLAASREKYAEMVDLQGKSPTPPSGTSKASTAGPASSPVSFSLPASGKLVDAD